jgi:photosystem II stability/assembly factor-like uncharacterized protein
MNHSPDRCISTSRWPLLATGVLIFTLLISGTLVLAEGVNERISGPVPLTAVPSEVWEIVAPDGIAAYNVADIEASNQNTAYAILDKTPGTVLKTANYGDNWTSSDLATGFGWTEHVSAVNSNTVWIGSVDRGVAITSNGGGSWGYAGAVSYQYALEATSDLHAWVGGYFPGGGGGWIYATEVGGGSDPGDWVHQLALGGACMDIDSSSANSAWAVSIGGYHGWIWRWNGTAWEDKSPSPYPQELTACSAVDSNTAWCIGNSVILRTTNGGTTWQTFTLPEGTPGLTGISALDANTAIVVGLIGTIYKTSDGGSTWLPMYSCTDENLKSVCMVDNAHGWATGDKGTVLRLTQANTRPGSGVTVKLVGGDSITFTSVTSSGNTIETILSAPVTFDNYFSVGLGKNISTSAAYTGPITVRLYYDDGYVSGLNEEMLRLFHLDSAGNWVDVTTNVDTANNIVTGQVSSLSDFTIAYPVPHITSITPNTGVRNSTVSVTIKGSNFWGTPNVKLTRLGVDIVATDVAQSNQDTITCNLPIPADASLGTWTLNVENPDWYGDVLYNGFTLYSAPSITVTAPNGGENWKQGSSQTITWSYIGNPGSNVRIELLKGPLVNLVISSSTSIGLGGTGSFGWTISSSQTTGTDFKIRITSLSNSAYTDASNANFTISTTIINRSAIGTFRSGKWYLDSTGDGTWNAGDRTCSFGLATDKPASGDWNKNGRTEIGAFRSGTWYLDYTGDGSWNTGDKSYKFGLATDNPVTGDWNGDGRTEIGAFRSGTWYLDYTGDGSWNTGDKSYRFGLATDKPVTGDWNGDGRTEIGAFRSGTWYLDYTGDGSWNTGDKSYRFGMATDVPVTGAWP